MKTILSLLVIAAVMGGIYLGWWAIDQNRRQEALSKRLEETRTWVQALEMRTAYLEGGPITGDTAAAPNPAAAASSPDQTP